MAIKVHLDFETKSEADLKKVGAFRYAMDPTTSLLIASWRVEDEWGEGPVRRWTCLHTEPPQELIDLVAAGATVCAHNAMFELAIWTYVCERMGWGKLSPYQMDCTMARAYVMALQGSLDRAGWLMNVRHKKDPEGLALMHLFSIPRKLKKGEDPDAVRFTDPREVPEKFERYGLYCDGDVLAECDLDKALPQLSDSERNIYHFDLLVNMRGFRLDTKLMRKAAAFIDVATSRANVELERITDGAVGKGTQVARLKDWLNARGIPVMSLGKGEIEDIIEHARLFDDPVAERAVVLRRQVAKATSLSKFRTGLGCVGFDERARGLLQYHKASTGRWSASIYQPHNLETVDPDEDMPMVEQMLHILREAASADDAVDWAELCGYTPLNAIGKCTRAMIVASDGKELMGCDYSNVEGRGSAWLAGEQWKIEAFLAYDAGTGPDLYKLAYSKSFGEPVETIGKGRKRQIGKVQELSLGYQGGVGALLKMALQKGMKPSDLRDAVKPVATPHGWNAAMSKYGQSYDYGLDHETWAAFRYVVDGWRAGHGHIVQGWWDLADAVVAAVSEPGQNVWCLNNKVRVYCQRNKRFMFIYLPSGRPLAYFKPQLHKTVKKLIGADGEPYERTQWNVIIEGNDSRSGSWGEVSLYGGILWNNVVQGMCRDLLAHGVMACERAGYPTVLHVHDEGVYEVPEGTGDTHEVQRLMAVLPPWAAGFPLTSSAWRDRRYVK
jgi:DNA polymerase